MLNSEGKLKTHSSSESDLRQVARQNGEISRTSNDVNSNVSTDTSLRDSELSEMLNGSSFLGGGKNSSQSLISVESRSLESENGDSKSEIFAELKQQKELYEAGLKRLDAAIADFEAKKVKFKILMAERSEAKSAKRSFASKILIFDFATLSYF